MLTAVIVDDETSGREIITLLLQKIAPDIEILGQAGSVKDAISLLNEETPDILFLDVEMPTGTGFSILEQIPDLDSEIIFVTAYDKYALEAIRVSALDYLLKPIDREEFAKAIEKARKNREQKRDSTKATRFLNAYQQLGNRPDRIVLPTQDGFQVILCEEVIWVQGDGAYTRFFLTHARQVMVSKMLKEYDHILEEHGFFRIHRSHMINISHVRRYFKGRGGEVEMSDGSVLAVSREKKDEFIAKLL